MKILKVYTNNGFITYDDLYIKYSFERKGENATLIIYEVDEITADESICAIYREWQHLEIEET